MGMERAPLFRVIVQPARRRLPRALLLEILPVAGPLVAFAVISLLGALSYAVPPFGLIAVPVLALAVIFMFGSYMISGLGWIEMDRRRIGVPLLLIRGLAVAALYVVALEWFVMSFDCGSDCQDGGSPTMVALTFLFAVTVTAPMVSALLLWLTARSAAA